MTAAQLHLAERLDGSDPQGMADGIVRKILVLLAAAVLTGCATMPDRPMATAAMQEQATLAGYQNIRIWQDADATLWTDWRTRFLEARSGSTEQDRPVTMLAISSGSDKGAYSAGFLVGWSETGQRPVFDLVSGVSTGALIAPFAFLGSDYDYVIREVYTQIDANDVYRARPLQGLLGGAAMADTAPLRDLIARHADAALLDAVAHEHRKGRRLLVQTTNLDAERGAVWDLGAIAASDQPDRLELFRQVLLASSSIPGFFPPVLIEVTANGERFEEMHVDGGTTSSLFALPPSVIFAPETRAGFPEGRLVILYNGALEPVYRTTEPRAFTIMERALYASIKEADRRSLRQLRAFAQANALQIEVYSAGPQSENEDAELFDTEFMRRLFAKGESDAESAAFE